MPGSGIRDDVAPWSFFLPVTLAVVVGVLAAGLVQRGIDRVFPGDGRREAVTDAAPPAEKAAAPQAAVHEAAQAPVATPAVSAPEPEPGSDAVEARGAGTSVETAPGTTAPRDATSVGDAAESSPPVLPGAIVAIREGAPEACIHGTIAVRDVNGWQQRLENDAPVACTEQSGAPR